MKSLSSLINRTPWWALLGGGLLVAVALALFTTPFQLIRLNKSGATPEENRAIKREVDLTFSEGAIDLARGVVKEMHRHAKDAVRREELERALGQLDSARDDLREAGAEVLRAKREAAQNVTEAVQSASRAIAEAQREAARALREAGVDSSPLEKSLQQSLDAAKKAESEARQASLDVRSRSAQRRAERAERHAEGRGVAPPEPPPLPDLPAPPLPNAPATAPNDKSPHPPVGLPLASGDDADKGRIVILSPDQKHTLLDLDLREGTAKAMPPTPPLPPEMRAQIREKVTGDLWRIGVGAGLILLFIPLFILTVVAKFFIDRSRASLRLAELTRKEAEYHRMSQQVTEAKLSALQAQVEPHFLYNTLASVQALTEVDPEKANAMTGHLIQYLRNTLPKMRESASTVGQEIELARAYLNILQMRMGKRLAFSIDVPAELADAPFPPLMLPSLVENAIKHGLEPQREGGEVRIRAECVDNVLRMVVADTGRGFAEVPGAGVGLANIRERLTAMYGEAGKLTLVANEPQGVAATIEIPRDGTRAGAGPVPADASAQAKAEAPRGAAARTLAAMGAAERVWRKSLTFTFMVLVVVAAVAAGLGLLGVMTSAFPVHFGNEPMGGAAGAAIGAAGIAAAFAVVVLALAIVLAVVYGLGFLFVGLAIFIPLVVLVALFPVLAPFLLVGLVIWWLVRRSRRKAQESVKEPAREEPTIGTGG